VEDACSVDGRPLPVRYRSLSRRHYAGSFPESPIIVTGGNPKSGKTEAGQMRNMLQLLGFPAIESLWWTRPIARCRTLGTVSHGRFDCELTDRQSHISSGVSDDAVSLVLGRRPFHGLWGSAALVRQAISGEIRMVNLFVQVDGYIGLAVMSSVRVASLFW
jgi:hypothetical protein